MLSKKWIRNYSILFSSLFIMGAVNLKIEREVGDDLDYKMVYVPSREECLLYVGKARNDYFDTFCTKKCESKFGYMEKEWDCEHVSGTGLKKDIIDKEIEDCNPSVCEEIDLFWLNRVIK